MELQMKFLPHPPLYHCCFRRMLRMIIFDLVLIVTPKLDSNIMGSWVRSIQELSVLFLQFFSVTLNLFQNKKVNKMHHQQYSVQSQS